MGSATALKWAAAGAYVTIADVLEDVGQQTAADLTAKGQHVTFVRCDVSDWASATAAFKHAISFGVNGGLDVAALYAGVVGDTGSLTDQVVAAKKSSNNGEDPVCPKHKGIEVNFRGLYETAWLGLYYMQGLQSEGERSPSPIKSLILVGSLGSYTDSPPYSDYNSAKCKYTLFFRVVCNKKLTQQSVSVACSVVCGTARPPLASVSACWHRGGSIHPWCVPRWHCMRRMVLNRARE